ncbi:MAG: YbbR-like domain-containing protein [Bacteroidales bacterium]
MFKNGKNIFSLERGRQIFLFLFCLFLAFIIWTVHKLSDQYSHFFQYRVYANVSLKGRATDSESSNRLIIRGRASGFYILQHRFSKGGSVVVFSPEKSSFKKVTGEKDLFYLLTSDIRDIIVESVEDKLIVDYLSADTLFFNYPEIGGKEVPVAVRSRTTFKEQYMPMGGFRLTPTTVMISGDADLINDIDSVYTTIINIYNADSPISGFVKLESVEGVSYSDEEIFYSLDVERYFEESKQAKVSVINIPDNVVVTVFPKSVYLIFKSSMNDAEFSMGNNLSVVIDYDTIDGATDTLLVAPPASIPQGVISYKMDPPFIRCTVSLKEKENKEL